MRSAGPPEQGPTAPECFDLANPYNQRKLDAVEQLAQLAEQAGLTLIPLAIGFAKSHPAVTSPLIGPRTMEQLETQLAAADVVLTDDLLDRIDELVAPGTTINPADSSFDNHALARAERPAAARPLAPSSVSSSRSRRWRHCCTCSTSSRPWSSSWLPRGSPL